MCFHSIKTQMNIRPRRASINHSVRYMNTYITYNVFKRETTVVGSSYTHHQHSARLTYMRKQIVKRLYFHIEGKKNKRIIYIRKMISS